MTLSIVEIISLHKFAFFSTLSCCFGSKSMQQTLQSETGKQYNISQHNLHKDSVTADTAVVVNRVV